MQTLVIYDIPKTKVRNKIANVCKDYGLTRVQWSAFLGDLSQNRREELGQKLRKTLGKAAGDVQIYPICDKDVKLRTHIVSKASGAKSERDDSDVGERRVLKRRAGLSRGSSGKPRVPRPRNSNAREKSSKDRHENPQIGGAGGEVSGDGTAGD